MNRLKMCCYRVIFGFLVLAGITTLPWNTEAFNVETRHYTSYRKDQSTMFGFSVAEYRDRNKRGWVIVGAPEAQTSQENVYRGGAVYRCDVAVDDSCIPVEFDRKDNNYVKNPKPPYNYMQIDNKTLQWFGATVSTSFEDGGPILACAPRYVFFSVSTSKNYMDGSVAEIAFGNLRDPVGTCWLTNFTTAREFSPCRTRNFGFHRQGSCQAGLGAALSRDGQRMFIGAPGSVYWQGQMYSVARNSNNFPFVPPSNRSFGIFPGQTFTQAVNNRGKVMFTKEGSDFEDDSYLGYSLTPGDFIGNGDSGTAVGMPRGYGLHGKVVLLSANMTNLQNITGEQMGGYFGYALTAGDIDGDGLDDLIIGAPMFTIQDNPEKNIETGRIYVFFGKGPDKYGEFVAMDGETNRGRLGMALASLGDIDRDGYGDFAVGAPYAGPEGRGAVYIYQGKRDGVLNKYSQVIYGEELGTNVRTFGFSIAGGHDLDDNLYPDMVVGSYESGTAMFFRSRPVIKMVPLDTYVEFRSSSKLISLDEKQCRLSDGTPVTCLPLKACFKYTGDGVLSRYHFNVQYVLDAKKTKAPRLFFLEHEGKNTMNKTIPVDRNQQFCRTVNVYVVPNIRDKLTSLDAEMRMGLDDESVMDNRPRNPKLVLRPVLATTSSRKDSISILKNCGPDNLCTPDLQLAVKPNVGRYLLGSGNRLELDVVVENAYEDAFEATYNLVLPPGVDYIKIERIDKAEIPVQCSAPKQSNNNTLKCDIGNPLPAGNLVHFTVILQPVDVHDEKSSYEFEMDVNSTNPEPSSTTHDNTRHLSLEIWVETELLIEGESKPKDVYYNPENYTSTNVTSELEYGPAFTHNYTIRNRGPSRIEEAEIFLVWPAATLAKDDLVYLLEQPETSGPIVCQSANANPLSLKLEQRSRIWHNYGTGAGVGHEVKSGTGHTINVDTGFEVTNEATATHVRGSGGNSAAHGITGGGGGRVIVHTGSSGGFVESGGGTFAGIRTSTENMPGITEIHRHGGSSWGSGGRVHEGNKTRTVVHGSDGEFTITEDEWKHTGGISTNVNVTRTVSNDSYRDQRIRQQQREEEEEKERKRQEEYTMRLAQQRIEEERLRALEEKEARIAFQKRREEEERIRQESRDNYGIRHHDSISGDREETIGASDFGIRMRNVTSTAELDSLLNTLTKDAVGFEVLNRRDGKYLQFLGRFRVAADGREYLEMKNGVMLPLENQYGEQSYAGSSNANDQYERLFRKMEGHIVAAESGKGYVQLKDGRRFPLQGSYSYTEEHTFTLGGNSRQDGSSWREESLNRGTESEFESYSARSHEEKRTFERKHESRGYERSDEQRLEEPLGDDPTRYRSTLGFHKRSSRYRRGDDAALSVDELRKYKKRNRLEKRSVVVDEMEDEEEEEEENDDFGATYPRHVEGLENSMDERIEGESVLPMCESARCVSLRCSLGRLEKDEEVWITARYRAKATTLKKVALNEKLRVSTQLVARVTKLPFIGKPAGELVKSHEIYTNLQPKAPAPEPDVVPLWVVVLSACAGTIILLLLILLLHKCGFFKRNRPTDAPERQPLNRNGHFHGDDHL